MIPTLIKLLDINIVANNFFGWRSKLLICSHAFDLLSFISSFSNGVNEKKATSDPDIKPERINSTTSRATEIRALKEKGLKISKSKIECNKGPGSSNY